jgi:hypothetical protein
VRAHAAEHAVARLGPEPSLAHHQPRARPGTARSRVPEPVPVRLREHDLCLGLGFPAVASERDVRAAGAGRLLEHERVGLRGQARLGVLGRERGDRVRRGHAQGAEQVALRDLALVVPHRSEARHDDLAEVVLQEPDLLLEVGGGGRGHPSRVPQHDVERFDLVDPAGREHVHERVLDRCAPGCEPFQAVGEVTVPVAVAAHGHADGRRIGHRGRLLPFPGRARSGLRPS